MERTEYSWIENRSIGLVMSRFRQLEDLEALSAYLVEQRQGFSGEPDGERVSHSHLRVGVVAEGEGGVVGKTAPNQRVGAHRLDHLDAGRHRGWVIRRSPLDKLRAGAQDR